MSPITKELSQLIQQLRNSHRKPKSDLLQEEILSLLTEDYILDFPSGFILKALMLPPNASVNEIISALSPKKILEYRSQVFGNLFEAEWSHVSNISRHVFSEHELRRAAVDEISSGFMVKLNIIPVFQGSKRQSFGIDPNEVKKLLIAIRVAEAVHHERPFHITAVSIPSELLSRAGGTHGGAPCSIEIESDAIPRLCITAENHVVAVFSCLKTVQRLTEILYPLQRVSIETVSAKAIERAFPVAEISELAERESWRKEINRPIYHIHKWWATRLGSVFRAITLGALMPSTANIWSEFYRSHNFSDKVILDPFMGSGLTLGESVKLGAKAVGCDINPVSTFLVRQAFTPVSETVLRQEFARLEASVADDIRQYYLTIDPKTGNAIPVLYFFWCKCVTTPDGEQVPLLTRYVFAQNIYPEKKPMAQILCPKCWDITEGRFDATEIACPNCRHEFNPQAGPAMGQFIRTAQGKRYKIKELLPRDGTLLDARLYAILAVRPDGSKVYLPARESDVALYQKASDRLKKENLPLPTAEVRSGHNTDQARGYSYFRWRDFFNDRQLLCLGMLLRAILKIENTTVQEQLLCLFSSTLEFNNQFCSFKGEGTGAVRHMFSHHILKPERMPLENSVWGHAKSSGTFSTLFESRLLRGKHYLDEPFELLIERNRTGKRAGTRRVVASPSLRPTLADDRDELKTSKSGILILNGDSSKLPVSDASIDAVITDPPYFDFIHYSELSDFFYAWLSSALAKRHASMRGTDSSRIGEVQHKDPRTFATLLAKVFKECHRVLKPDGILAFSFHHSKAEGWAAIHEAISASGFVVTTAHPVHSELRRASPKSAAKSPISLDSILVCRKRGLQIETRSGNAEVRAKEYSVLLESSGHQLSSSDFHVIFAAQMLVELSNGDHSFEFVRDEIKRRSKHFCS